MKSFFIYIFIFFGLFFTGCKSNENSTKKRSKLKVLILDGENNHGIWPKTTFMMKDYLEETGLFEVDINRKQYTWIGPHFNKVKGVDDINQLLTIYPLNDGLKRTAVDSTKYDPNYSPDFKKYDLVINNLGWKSSNWPEATKKNFENYMKNGGGLVLLHAASNPWANWTEYNKMIGLGGWSGRDEKSGPYIYYDTNEELKRDPSKGICASHGPQHNFVVKTRATNHPIMKDLPLEWLHSKDELYERLRGPGENMTILATAFSDPKYGKKKRTNRHEPLLMAIEYGKGRIFHSALGHMDYSMECVGFITTLQRGAEWVATGKVNQKIPTDFPKKDTVSIRVWKLKK